MIGSTTSASGTARPGAEGLHHPDRERRGRGGLRPLGLGQVDAHQMRLRPRAVPEGPITVDGIPVGDRGPTCRTARPHRHGVSAFRALPHMSVIDNIAGAAQGAGPGRRRARAAATPARARRPRDMPISRAALRRSAAARRDRPRARDGPDRDAVRRADLGARSGNDQRGAGRDGLAGQGGHDHDGRHP